MDEIWIALIAFAALVGVAVLIAGGVTLFLRIRGQQAIDLNPRLLLRIYLLVAILAGLLIFTQGAANLLQAALAEIDEPQFSYQPVWVSIPADGVGRTPTALELKDRDQLTDAEREELAALLAEDERTRVEQEEERRLLGLERARDEGLIEGVTFLLLGALIWGAHFAGRRVLEQEDERQGLLNRLFLTGATIAFGVITIVLLPQAIFESLNYALLDERDFGDHPGEMLVLSITTLPIWLAFLWQAIRAIKRTPA